MYNGLGDVMEILDKDGNAVVSYLYDAWGAPISVTGPMASTLGAQNPIRYRGYYYDTETGLYYLQSRYYDPVVGRFLNADGLLGANGDLMSYNLFAYCSNNPVNMSDPTGEIAAVTAAFICLTAAVILQGFTPENKERADNFMNEPNLYNTANWLTLGAVDTVKGAVQPEEPLSLQHWADSAQTALMVMPGISKGFSFLDSLTVSKTQWVPPMKTLATGVCFVAGTPIRVEEGYQNIEDIREGDLVWAKEPESGEVSLKRVVQIFERESDELVHIVVNGERISTTPEHPFYRPTAGWTSAIDLRAGDRLALLSGEVVVIEEVQHEILEKPITVYNFEVENFHTYFVGHASILVHNTCQRLTGNQQALLDLGREAQRQARTGRLISMEEALALDQWAAEYGIPQHHGAYLGSGEHWVAGWDHTHLYGKHIPFK